VIYLEREPTWNPTADTLTRIATALGLDLADLLNETAAAAS